MFDKYTIVDNSLRTTASGFTFETRLGYYRGLGLSMVEDLAVTLDGEEMPRTSVRFDEGEGPLLLDEMETAYDRRWNFGAVATVTVETGTRLPSGEHELGLRQKLRISYLPFPAVNTDQKRMAVA